MSNNLILEKKEFEGAKLIEEFEISPSSLLKILNFSGENILSISTGKGTI